MDYSIINEAGTGNKIDKLSVNQIAIENENSNRGLASLKQGQQITGSIVSTGEQVTLDFNGQKVTASKNVMGNTAPGEVKTFEVVKANGSEIELKLLDDNNGSSRPSFKATVTIAADFDTVLTQKERAVKKAEVEAEVKDTKVKLEDISAKLTEQDCKRLEEEGFPVESFTVKGLDEAVNRMKEEASSEAKNISAENQKAATNNIDSISTEKQKNTDGQSQGKTDLSDEMIIADKLRKANLPVTAENLEKIKQALDYSEAVSKLDNKAMQNLISRDAEPSPENIYKACYSSTAQSSVKLTDKTWNELEGQVKSVIKEAGYEPEAKNMEAAKWIIESKLPLTAETFEYKKELEQIKTMDLELILNTMVEGMKDGISPKDVSLLQPQEVSIQKVIMDILSLKPETITEAIKAGSTELTIKNLVELQENINNGVSSEKTVKEAVNNKKVETVIADGRNSVRAEGAGNKTVTQNFAGAESIDGTIRAESSRETVTLNEKAQLLAKEKEISKIDFTVIESEIASKNSVNQSTTSQSITSQSITSQSATNQSATSQDIVKQVAVSADSTKNENSKVGSNEVDDSEPSSPTKESIETLSGTENQSDSTQSNSSNSKDENSNNDTERANYEEVKAKRQLEEIRLKMTLEAATQLEKQGIKIETEQLGKVVDALRDLENRYYKEYFKEANVEATDASVQTLKETTQSIEQLKNIPSYVLGSTLTERNTQTIPNLLAEANKLQADLVKAGAAYETLMTTPSREYGDSIKKAFDNADSLLSEMNIENTEANKRAVRILGYNQMEITEESINQVKAYDLQVTTMVKNLHPAVTVRMIKDGINPLEMPIHELNQTIDKIKEEQGITSEDKYSTFLRQLDKTEGISEEERKAFIGVYRLLYNVEKSDGAALGAVIKADREVTLDNLLTAVQTGKKGRLNAVIDDEFGTLQSITRKEDSIAEQLSTFTKEKVLNSNGQPLKEDTIAEQTEYMDRILKQMKEELTPEKLTQAGINSMQIQNAQTSTLGSTSGTLQKGIWETIRNIPVENLHEQLQNIASEQAEDNEVYIAKVQEIRELSKSSEQSIRFLNDYHIPSTPLNMVMANHILSNGESPIKKLIKLQKENKVENSEISLKEIGDLSDTLIDKHSMQEVYTELEMDVKAAIDQSYSEDKIDSRKLAELKSLGQQMSFAKKMAEKEYYQIPVETDKGVTNMNLTILRGTQTSGKVSVTIRSEQLGNVKADFSLKDKALKGFISSDNRNGLEQLQSNTGEIEKAATENEVTIKQLDFVVQRRENDTYSFQNPNESSSVNADTERTLYWIAKAIVQTVRAAENSGSDTERAVS